MATEVNSLFFLSLYIWYVFNTSKLFTVKANDVHILVFRQLKDMNVMYNNETRGYRWSTLTLHYLQSNLHITLTLNLLYWDFIFSWRWVCLCVEIRESWVCACGSQSANTSILHRHLVERCKASMGRRCQQ